MNTGQNARPLSDIAAEWLALWNGDHDVLADIVAEDIVIHTVSADGSRAEEMRGRQALGEWIRQIHASFSERTTYEITPIIADDHLVLRWHSTGSYRGGMAGVPPEAVGQPIDYRGIDILRTRDGMVVEFWISADLSVLLHQLGVWQS